MLEVGSGGSDFEHDRNGVVVHTNSSEDFDEATGLMTQSLHFDDDFDLEDRAYSGSFRTLTILMVVVLIIATLAVVIPETGSMWWLKSPARIPVEYSCPFPIDEGNTSASIAQNATAYLEDFKAQNFEKWDNSYETLKSNLWNFTAEYFAKYLKDDGNAIYESSCGIGLGLYMTLEILKESAGIENLIVYGSDHHPLAVEEASAVLGSELAPAHAETGIFCSASSAANLSFVPSESFDLVFTSYISPLKDPLEFNKKNRSVAENLYASICNSSPDDWKGLKLKEISQQAQKDWYGEWVKEMTRIAKPGTPIIVEQVSKPFCEAQFDWGGVNKEFWTMSAQNNTYDWDVDSESIVIEDDTLFRERYHVVMLKNGNRIE